MDKNGYLNVYDVSLATKVAMHLLCYNFSCDPNNASELITYIYIWISS
jgi:hypothetical protein